MLLIGGTVHDIVTGIKNDVQHTKANNSQLASTVVGVENNVNDEYVEGCCLILFGFWASSCTSSRHPT